MIRKGTVYQSQQVQDFLAERGYAMPRIGFETSGFSSHINKLARGEGTAVPPSLARFLPSIQAATGTESPREAAIAFTRAFRSDPTGRRTAIPEGATTTYYGRTAEPAAGTASNGFGKRGLLLLAAAGAALWAVMR